MPALITPQQAASEILQGWAQGAFEIHFPKRFTLWMKALQLSCPTACSFNWFAASPYEFCLNACGPGCRMVNFFESITPDTVAQLGHFYDSAGAFCRPL
jgi:hypothetical protein